MSTFAEDNLSEESLQKELQNKDNIILALTEQLESTVDQLDRLKRSGVKEGAGDSRSQSPFGLASQVADALEAYDELAPAEHFERIENGIDQILQMLSQGAIQLASTSESGQAPPEPDDSFWEETKARLLGGESPEDANKSQPPSSPEQEDLAENSTSEAEEAKETESNSEQAADQEPIIVPDMPAAPQPITNLKDVVELEEGVGQRDEYIGYLVARLRKAEQARTSVINLDELIAAPQKLVEELKELKQQLKDQLRQAEIASSLERASLTRERSKLFQVKQYLAQEIKKLGDATAQMDENGEPGNKAESRWGKFFDTKK